MSREQNETMERVTDAMDEQIATLRRERDQAEQGRREALAEAQRAWDAATAMRAECETMASERNAAWREASDLRVALDKVRAQRMSDDVWTHPSVIVCQECCDVLPSHHEKCSRRPPPRQSPATLDFVVGCRYSDLAKRLGGGR